jgi:HSP20 family protein
MNDNFSITPRRHRHNENESWLDTYFNNSIEYFSKKFTPSIDIEEAKDKFLVSVDLPGVKEQDIDLTIEDKRLIIKGKRESRTDSSNDRELRHSERSYGEFTRSFTLPTNTIPDEIKASYENGILEILIPKNQIQVNSKKVNLQPKKH